MTNAATAETPKRTQKALPDGATRASHLVMSPESLVIIGLDTKDDNTHPLWDPRIQLALDDAMVRNIMHLGVIEDITGTLSTIDGVERVVVVDGRRRTMHAREANKRFAEGGSDQRISLRVNLRKGENKYLFGTKEAANRFRVTDSPLVTARNISKAMDMGSTIDEVALHLGVTDQTVRNFLAMLNLAPEVQEDLNQGWLTSTAALMLAPLPADAQREVAAEIKQEQRETGKKTSVAKVQAKVKAKKGQDSKPGLTPTERINKVIAILKEAAPVLWDTKAPQAVTHNETLNRICRACTGRNMEQLVKALEKEAEEEKAKKSK